MYLFVSTFLLMAVIGLFTELFLVQSARFWQHQTAAAEVMTIWHLGAYTLAKELAAQITPDCSVSPVSVVTGLALCDGGKAVLVNPAGPYCGDCVTPHQRHYLPVGYDFNAPMLLPSIVYASGGQRYLLTYIKKEASGQTAWLGFTYDDILNQLRNANTPGVAVVETSSSCNNAFGTTYLVTQPLLVNGTTSSYRQACYPYPASVTLGQIVGLISPL